MTLAQQPPGCQPIPQPGATWSVWQVTRSTAAAVASSRNSTATAAAPATPLYRARRTLHTGSDRLTNKQSARLRALFATDDHVEVEATWSHLPAHDRRLPRTRPHQEPQPHGDTDHRRQYRSSSCAGGDHHAWPDAEETSVLAYFDRPSTSNGPTEALNGRLEHLRGSALGFRNLTNYIAYAEFRISDGMSTSGLC